MPKMVKLVSMMTEVANFPKSFRMIGFVNKQIKDSAKRFNCNINLNLTILVYNELVEYVSIIEGRRE